MGCGKLRQVGSVPLRFKFIFASQRYDSTFGITGSVLCSNCAQCAVPAATAVSAVLVQNPPDKTMIQNNTVAVCIFWKYICFEIKYILRLAKHFQPSQDSSAPMTITL